MENNINISLPRGQCMKCREENDILLTPYALVAEMCSHKICQSCFRNENTDLPLASDPTYIFTCPCCHTPFYTNMQSIDEAILLGQAVTLKNHITPKLLLPKAVVIAEESILCATEINKLIIDKLESALLINPTNVDTLYLLYLSCSNGYTFLIRRSSGDSHIEWYVIKLYEYSFLVLDHPATAGRYEFVRGDCWFDLATIFLCVYRNYPPALKFSKLAYEHCLRSSDHSHLAMHKALYLKSRAAFAKMPPLRFAVGDEVEFLHAGGDDGVQWKLGKVIELYYRQKSFDLNFTAPYLVKYEDSDSADQPIVHIWVTADIDRYVRKVGVRSIEDTRYAFRLNAKVEKLDQVYCSREFIENVYDTLAQDREFVEMLQSVWQIELSEFKLSVYRVLVMYRKPLVRTDSGYHVPSSEEFIAGIKAYFDPALLSGHAAPTAGVGQDSDLQEIRSVILDMCRGAVTDTLAISDDLGAQGLLFQGSFWYLNMLIQNESRSSAGVHDSNEFTIPLRISDAVSRALTTRDLELLQSDPVGVTKADRYLTSWITLHACLENPDFGSECECPFAYFFIKECLDHGWGVPKLALVLYDKMDMQLSREFIRCANSTCEINRLDQSTGQVKFKLCSRCKAVIYCSRECQTVHYPEHKILCREHSIG